MRKPDCMTRPLLYLVVHPPPRAGEKGLREGQLLLYQGFHRKEKKGSIIRFIFMRPWCRETQRNEIRIANTCIEMPTVCLGFSKCFV